MSSISNEQVTNQNGYNFCVTFDYTGDSSTVYSGIQAEYLNYFDQLGWISIDLLINPINVSLLSFRITKNFKCGQCNGGMPTNAFLIASIQIDLDTIISNYEAEIAQQNNEGQ